MIKNLLATLAVFGLITSVAICFAGISSAQGPNNVNINKPAINNSLNQLNNKCKETAFVNDIACQAIEGSDNTLYTYIKTIINTLLYVVGVVAVVMTVIAGIRLTSSGGNPDSVKSARMTILYAVIGIIVSFTAWALVNFVIQNLAKSEGANDAGSSGSGVVKPPDELNVTEPVPPANECNIDPTLPYC